MTPTQTPSHPTARILIVDDHALFRAGVRALVERQPHLRCVGESSTVEEALATAGAMQPDVVLLDLSMNGGASIDSIRKFRSVAPSTRVLVVTMHEERAYLRAALGAGASGYVIKRSPESELVAAIDAVLAGRFHFDASLAGALMGDLDAGQTAMRHADDTLSPREREVLSLIAAGHTVPDLAEKLGVSRKTAETYRARLGDKLGLSTRAELVQYALAHGIVAAPTVRPVVE